MASSSARPRPDDPEAFEKDVTPFEVACSSLLGTVAVYMGRDIRRAVEDGRDPVMLSAVSCGGLAAVWARLPETWAELSDATVAGVVEALDAAAEADFARAGLEAVRIATDPLMGRMAEQGARDMAASISETTAWGNVRLRVRSGRLVPIQQAYDDMLVDAVTQVARDGREVQAVVRELADQLVGSRGGIRIVRTDHYGTDRSYDITGAVRQDVWDHRARVMQELRGEQGRLCGMDAVEITAHATCAPDHIEAQGKIYTLDAFAKLQDSLRRPIGYWNCRHIAWPCWSDSTPSQSAEELREMREMSERLVSFVDARGRERLATAYEFTQWQRAQERAIRAAKTAQMLAESAGQSELVSIYRESAKHRRRVYMTASARADVRPMPERLLVGTLA